MRYTIYVYKRRIRDNFENSRHDFTRLFFKTMKILTLYGIAVSGFRKRKGLWSVSGDVFTCSFRAGILFKATRAQRINSLKLPHRHRHNPPPHTHHIFLSLYNCSIISRALFIYFSGTLIRHRGAEHSKVTWIRVSHDIGHVQLLYAII